VWGERNTQAGGYRRDPRGTAVATPDAMSTSARATSVLVLIFCSGSLACAQISSRLPGRAPASAGAPTRSAAAGGPSTSQAERDARRAAIDAERERGFALGDLGQAIERQCLMAREDHDPKKVEPGLVVPSVAHKQATVKNAFEAYKRKRDEVLAKYPDLASSTEKRKRGNGDEFVVGDELKACDAWFPAAMVEYEQLLAKAQQREKSQNERREAATKEHNAREAEWASKLTGDRKATHADRGWPNDSEGGDQWAKIIKARWWMYGSQFDMNSNKYLCEERIYFSGDRIAKRERKGLCR
jgi:hypothetical protein